jgi:hypothetical protein
LRDSDIKSKNKDGKKAFAETVEIGRFADVAHGKNFFEDRSKFDDASSASLSDFD